MLVSYNLNIYYSDFVISHTMNLKGLVELKIIMFKYTMRQSEIPLKLGLQLIPCYFILPYSLSFIF